MIKEIIEKGSIAFICNSFDHIKQFIEISKREGINYEKMGWKESDEEDMFETYIQYLSNKHKSIIIIKKKMISMEYGVRFEHQFYSRTYKNYHSYNDWDNYTFVDFTQLLRDSKLKELGI
jgi:hypothetical protein